MRKSFKKVAAVAMAMALTAASSVSVFASEFKTYTGQIAADDLKIDIDLPASGTLTMKPYAATAIASENGLCFVNKSTEAKYGISLAGYTCVGTSKDEASPIKVATALPATSKAKDITVKITIGTADAATGKVAYADGGSLSGAAAYASAAGAEGGIVESVSKLSTASYDGKTNTTMTAATSKTKVVLDKNAGGANNKATFAIVGEMNTSASWATGDKLVVVPIFDITVEK